ncbi:protein FD-like isoform X2 [Beta vulgaris subsp. vulgaris]|uniref:protein FD-like isoform X2 n=1 Tax=Beta vulgaris subsp. vulgaris TaxID=3555 RepID=UPI0020368218|nr:protein FD-like isoform X2 [Beta vulgaris subsp. vulgaris]
MTSTESRSLSSSSSSSPSPSPSPSPFSPSFSLHKPNKIMEEVWKDITMNSLPNTPIHHIHTIHHPTPTSHFKGMILQDFLNASGAGDSRINSIRSSSSSSSSPLYSPPPPPPPPPPTEFQFFDSERFQIQRNSPVSNFIAFDNSLAASFGVADDDVVTGINKKRLCQGDEDASGDRRFKRMIKNRESAARSRARKQFIEETSAQLPKKHGLHRTSTAPF